MNSTPLHLLSPTTLLQQSTIYKLAVEIVSCFSSSFFLTFFLFSSFFESIDYSTFQATLLPPSFTFVALKTETKSQLPGI